jgi:hypothetical protein
MTSPRVYRFQVFEQSGATVFARILNPETGNPIVQADVSSISYKVFKVNNGGLPSQEGSITVASVIFDTLQTNDPRWTFDQAGYNFAWSVPASFFAEGGSTYRIELLFIPTTGEQYHVVYEAQTADLLSY